MLGIFFAVGFLAPAILVAAQEGFISLDCGRDEGYNYKNKNTTIIYSSDAQFVETGINASISSDYNTTSLSSLYYYVRSFPEGSRNCYTLNPRDGKGNKYLVRAHFMYGNYDGKNEVPEFDLYLGVNLWKTMTFNNASHITRLEIIVVALLDFISVCLVNTDGGTPFISALELRPLDKSLYNASTESEALMLYSRADIGLNSNEVRYQEDVYDRIWLPFNFFLWDPFGTSNMIKKNIFQTPSVVMMTAVRPNNSEYNLTFIWNAGEDPNIKYHLFMHFAELEELKMNELRNFSIYLNGNSWYPNFSPRYLLQNTIYSVMPLSGLDSYRIDIMRTKDSTLPPILNALEIYIVKQLSVSPTYYSDVEAIMDIKSTYKVKRNWMGDPCVPLNHSWAGLNCSYDGPNSPRIISLNLASSGLNGDIADSLANLTSLQSLDLSGNNLTGIVPSFLASLPVSYLNLTSNNLTGSVPMELQQRSSNNLLSLSVNDNPNLCNSDKCEEEKSGNSKEGKIVNSAIRVAVITPTVILLIILIIV